MIRISDIIDTVLGYFPNANVKAIEQAYVYSAKLHKGHIRLSGEPYMSHLLETANILARMRMDVETIVAGLLHDTLEDTSATREELDALFGKEVAEIVDGVTKISKLKFESKEERQASNINKLVLAMSSDIRVIIVKLADRLHNMRTLGYHPHEKQLKIARETLDIYAPIAARLGIHWLKSELEDLSLYYLDTKSYNHIKNWLAIRKGEKEQFIEQVKEAIYKKLKENSIEATVKGRFKHIYSIYRKQKVRNVDLEDIQDILAFRVIVETVRECYESMGYIHAMWPPIQRFKDYIAVPKPNGYRSLHTAVLGPNSERMEIQIRTYEMDREAEEGISAHWNYKEGGRASQAEIDNLKWLRQLVEQNLEDPKDYLKSIKRELQEREDIYVFTPKGLVINLPKGATPIDFAYAIHTEVGNRCSGAKINNKMATITTPLKTGDVVEIITNPKQRPSRDWLKYVKTSKAINKIKHWLKAQEKEEAIAIGKGLFEKAIQQAQIPAAKITDNILDDVAREFSLKSGLDLYAEIGFGNISPKQVASRLRQRPELQVSQEEKEAEIPIVQKTQVNYGGITVKGVEDVLVRFAACCKPVPGEKVVGFMTRGRGITIHRKNCKNLIKGDNGRIVDINWDPPKGSSYPVRVKLIALDRKGLLADITGIISKKNSNIVSLDSKTTKDRKAIGYITLEVRDIAHLREIIIAIRALKDVIKVSRA